MGHTVSACRQRQPWHLGARAGRGTAERPGGPWLTAPPRAFQWLTEKRDLACAWRLPVLTCSLQPLSCAAGTGATTLGNSVHQTVEGRAHQYPLPWHRKGAYTKQPCSPGLGFRKGRCFCISLGVRSHQLRDTPYFISCQERGDTPD